MTASPVPAHAPLTETIPPVAIDLVVKVGGSLLELEGALLRLCAVLGATRERVLVVPGGGRFADAVRACDHAHGLDPTAAHWMAVLAMDQYAHLLASLVPGAALISHPREIAPTLASGRTPVLAPYQWLREADPLPHSWSVTSDSIAAWITGVLGAPRLVLVKPVSGTLLEMTDAHFATALPPGVLGRVSTVDEIEAVGV
jgi:aspartokinase-like uncharacterized kinase